MGLNKCPECQISLKGVNRKRHALSHWGKMNENKLLSLSPLAQKRYTSLTGMKPAGSK